MSRITTFRIIISETGARTVTRSIRSIGDAARSTIPSVRFLRNTLAALAGIAIVNKVAGFSNELQTLRNRLVLVTRTADDAVAVFDELRDVSNETRSSIFATANVYSRFSLATRELGLSQREVLDLVKSLNQAVILSGANAREAEAGLLQFSQGLASGRLAGDELRAVLEQLPIIADVIGKELGVTRGALRFLAREGKITPDVIVRGFSKAAAELRENFGKTLPTIAQSMTILHNAVIDLLNTMDKSTGLLAKISKVILYIAENIEFFTRLLLFGGLLAGMLLLTQILASMAGSLFSLTNPLGIIISLVGLLTTGFLAAGAAAAVFSDKIQIETGWITLAELGQAVLDELAETLKTMVGYLDRELPQSLEKVVQKYLVPALRKLAELSDPIVAQGGGFVAALLENLVDAVPLVTGLGKTILLNIVGYAKEAIIALAKLAGELIAVAIENRIRQTVGLAKTLYDPEKALSGLGSGLLLTPEEAAAKQRFTVSFNEALQDLGDAPVSDWLRRVFTRASVLAKQNAERLSKQTSFNADQPGLEPTGLKSLAQVRIETEISDLKLLVGTLQLTNRERKMQIEIEKNLKDVREDAGDEVITDTQKDQLAILVRQRSAYNQLTDSLDNFGDALPASQVGLDRLSSIARMATYELELLFEQFSAGEITAEQLNVGIERLDRSLRLQASIYEEVFGAADKYEMTLEAIEANMRFVSNETDKLTLELIALRAAQDRLANDPTAAGGIERGILKIKEDILDIGQLYEDTLTNAFSNAEDAVVEFITTSKNGFRELAESIGKDLVRIGLRQFLTGPLFNAFTAGVGGGGGLAGARAEGGPVGSNRSYLVGEQGPEILRMGSQGGTIIPNHAMSSGGNTYVTMNIETNDADSFRRSRSQIERAARSTRR